MKAGRQKNKWWSYENTKNWVQKIAPIHKITSYEKWIKFTTEFQIPEGVPTNPRRTYKDKYISDYDFFGNSVRPYLSYEAAKTYLKPFKIKSYRAWLAWYVKNRPLFIPSNPPRFYEDAWVSYNDFLSTGKGEPKVKYYEAIKWVHKQKIKSNTEWRLWCKENKIPKGIPHRPDLAYAEWVNWPTWLGKSISARLSVQEKNTSILFILQESDTPSNVYTIGIEKDGLKELEMWKDFKQFTICKLYEFEVGKGNLLNQIISENCTVWWEAEEDNQYLVSNIYSLVGELDYYFKQLIIDKK